ncbi:uncharacterized protein LOC108665095 isoform X2 [Hyalella azteca]|uniref:Uncharacterized protein LOC108665095 isoform X2 n=1 Tax=Hyalella azteca TaxID=294128 RepID=A0A979FJU9_HYAAZ|nr:uncharacterized protein LOC108665095 isoform X2 [Hyalella azteca]
MEEFKRTKQPEVNSSLLIAIMSGIVLALAYSHYLEVQVPTEEIRRRREAYGYGAVADTAPTTPPKLGCHPGVNDPQLRSLPHLYKDVAPDPWAQNIYQIEVSMAMKIKHKTLCSIESMCTVNSDAHVWFLVTRATLDASSAQRLLSLQKICPRLCVAHVNVRTVMRNTAAHALLSSDDFWNTPHLFTQLSDLLRYAIVYHSGGLYTDTDILALRPFKNSSKNFFTAQGNEIHTTTNSLFHFERYHPTPMRFLQFVSDTFSPVTCRLVYASLGPHAVVRFLLSDECAYRFLLPHNAPERYPAPDDHIGPCESSRNDLARSDGTSNGSNRYIDNFSGNIETLNYHHDREDYSSDCVHDIFGKTAHQPIHFMNSHSLFSRNKTLVGPEDNIFPGTFTFELYNSHTKAIPVEEGSLVDIIARKTCPLTHSKCPSLMCN